MVKSGFSGVLSGRIAKRLPSTSTSFTPQVSCSIRSMIWSASWTLELERRPRLDEALDLVGIPPRQAPAPGLDVPTGG